MIGGRSTNVDLNGDRKSDIGVYRDGAWLVLRSDGRTTATEWGGLAQDIPVPADYDGDGKVDIAVYREGVWLIKRSSDRDTAIVVWGGLAQDIVVPGDYDGDWKTDPGGISRRTMVNTTFFGPWADDGELGRSGAGYTSAWGL